MSCIMFVGDQHLGLRGANPIFEQEFELFCDRVLFPVIEDYKPAAIILLGDLFDDRVRLNVKTINLAKKFLDRLRDTDIPVFVLIGNHDIPFRDRVIPNSVEPLLREYAKINAVEEPTDLTIQEHHFLLVPWICRSNESKVLSELESTSASYLCGHFDMPGFEISPGTLSTHGIDPDSLSKFELVVSGHYHTWSKKGNILYAGAPYQMTRADDGQLKRIWVLDLDTKQLKSIVNDRNLFQTVRIRGDKVDGMSVDDWRDSLDYEFGGKIITIVAADDADDTVLDVVVREIETEGAHDVKVVDTRSSLSNVDVNIEEIQTAGTLQLIHSYIDADPDLKDLNRDRLKEIMTVIHAEALGGSGDEE